MLKNQLILAAIICEAVACLLQVVGVATKGWITIGGYSAGVGLFTDDRPTYSCALGTFCVLDDGWMKAARAFGIITILVMAGATAIGVLAVLNDNKTNIIRVTSPMCFAATHFSSISFAIFAIRYVVWIAVGFTMSFGYSFVLCVVAAVLSAFAGGFFYYGKLQILNPPIIYA